MPAITSGKILVTGANGFVAAWVVKELLDHGFSVRGTVRSEDKATYLRDRLKTYGDKLEFALVDDITKVGILLQYIGLRSSQSTYRKALSTQSRTVWMPSCT